MAANHPEISLVVPCHNESENISALYERVFSVMQQTEKLWEMVCINDGSKDDTLELLLALNKKDPRVVVVDLSRNFGKEAALTAGLDYPESVSVAPNNHSNTLFYIV